MDEPTPACRRWVLEQHIDTPVSVYLGDIDITDGVATLDIVDDGPVEMMIPVRLGALGGLCIRFEG